MSIDIAVIPVAGHGTRLLPLTKSQPKEMLAVGRKPVVQYVVEELVRSGVRRQLFVTGPGKTAIENHFDENQDLVERLRVAGKEELLQELDFERQDVEYFYTRQRRQLGLGHAVLCARPMLENQSFVVALGDSIIGLNAQSDIVRRMINLFNARKPAAVIAFEEVPAQDVSRYGIARPRTTASDVFDLLDLVEKPKVGEAPSNLAIAARYVCGPQVFGALAETEPGTGGEIQLTDALRRLLGRGELLIGVRLAPHEKRFDIGNFESYFRAFTEFALADGDHGAALRGFLKELLRSPPAED